MWTWNTISSIGLIADILGVILLFMYGLPSKLIEHNIELFELNTRDANEIEREDERIKKHNKRVKVGAYAGLTLILIGFILQFIGTNYTPN